MAIDKKINYKDQRLTKAQQKKAKPANQGGGPNYLGKEKTVTVPKKWLSSPDHVVAELAYITPREQKILLDADLYGSLKGKPNKGPGGIMSLQGDLGGYSSNAGGTGSGDSGKGKGGNSNEDYKNTDYYNMMTGTGTTATSSGGDTVRSKNIARGAMPEVAYGPDNRAKMMYSQKAASNPQGFFGKLFSGNNQYGYRDTYNKTGGFMGFGGQKDVQFNPVTQRYEFEEEETGNVKPGRGGQILGGLAGLLTGIPFVGGAIGKGIDRFKSQPKDMSQYNELGLYGQVPEDFELGNQKISDTSFTQGTTSPTEFNIGDEFFSNNPEVRGMMNYGITETQPFGNPNRFTNDLAPNYQDMATNIGLTEKQKGLLDQRKGMLDALGPEAMLNNIQSEDDPNDPATLNDVKKYYGLPV